MPLSLSCDLLHRSMLFDKQSWKCRDISSTFQVSGLPDTIPANESRMKEILAKIVDLSAIYSLFTDDKTMRRTNTLFGRNFCILVDISVVIGDISLMI